MSTEDKNPPQKSHSDKALSEEKPIIVLKFSTRNSFQLCFDSSLLEEHPYIGYVAFHYKGYVFEYKEYFNPQTLRDFLMKLLLPRNPSTPPEIFDLALSQILIIIKSGIEEYYSTIGTMESVRSIQQAIPYLEDNLKKNPLYAVMLAGNPSLRVYEAWMKHVFTIIMSQETEINSDVSIYVYVFDSVEERKIGVKTIKSSRKRCGQCKKPSKLLCSKCKVIFYCCPECQMTHWPEHKKICSLIQPIT